MLFSGEWSFRSLYSYCSLKLNNDLFQLANKAHCLLNLSIFTPIIQICIFIHREILSYYFNLGSRGFMENRVNSCKVHLPKLPAKSWAFMVSRAKSANKQGGTFTRTTRQNCNVLACLFFLILGKPFDLILNSVNSIKSYLAHLTQNPKNLF